MTCFCIVTNWKKTSHTKKRGKERDSAALAPRTKGRKPVQGKIKCTER